MDEFFEWFRSQDPERLHSKELAAKDAWDYQQAKLQVAEEELATVRELARGAGLKNKELQEEVIFLSDARDAVFRSNNKLQVAVEALEKTEKEPWGNNPKCVSNMRWYCSEALEKIKAK